MLLARGVPRRIFVAFIEAQVMPTTQFDVASLSRGGSEGSGPPGGRGGVHTLVPKPASRWKTRLLLPLVIASVTAGLLIYAARGVLLPAVEVYVSPVIPVSEGAGWGASGDAESVGSGASEPVDGEVAASGEVQLGSLIVQAPGWIEPAPYAVWIPALAEGVVEEVLVLEGDTVRKGQVVARLIGVDAELKVRDAFAVVARGQADVSRAEAAIATARSKVRVEQSVAEELRDQVSRKRELVRAGAVGEGEFRQLEIRLVGLEAIAQTAEREVDEAEAALKQAQSAAKVFEVMLAQAELLRDRMEIRSPVDGVVLSRLVEPGTRIALDGNGVAEGPMSGTVLRVYDPQSLQVRVDVPLAEAGKVEIGTLAVITTEAEGDVTFSGVVTRAVHEANIQRNTVQFKVSVQKPSSVLKPEMLARVKLYSKAGALKQSREGRAGGVGLEEGQSGPVLVIPADAAVSTGEGKGWVWTVRTGAGSARATRNDITFAAWGERRAQDQVTRDGGGDSRASFVAVTEGLRVTDRVIVGAPLTLQDGSRVKVLGERRGLSPG